MPLRTLVTGCGGASGAAVVRTLSAAGFEVLAADMSRFAAGLYMVPAENRFRVPAADSPELVPELLRLCVHARVDVLIPMVPEEMLPIAEERGRFELLGTQVLVSPEAALQRVVDRWCLAHELDGHFAIPRTALFNEAFAPVGWRFPLALRQREGGGPTRIILDRDELDTMERDGHHIVQEFLSGREYVVDVMVAREGRVVAAVPRERIKVADGMPATTRTVRDPELQALAGEVARHLGLRGAISVQVRRDQGGRPRVIDVEPRPGPGSVLSVEAGVDTMALAVRDLLGLPIPEAISDFPEVGMVRVWEPRFVDARELDEGASEPGSRANRLH